MRVPRSLDLCVLLFATASLIACSKPTAPRSTAPGLPVYVDFPDAGTCAVGRTLCGAGCVNLLSHPDHCGACGTACSAGEVCVGGQCTGACPAPDQRTAPCMESPPPTRVPNCQ